MTRERGYGRPLGPSPSRCQVLGVKGGGALLGLGAEAVLRGPGGDLRAIPVAELGQDVLHPSGFRRPFLARGGAAKGRHLTGERPDV